MPALLAAVMKWEPICGIRGIEFLADLHINSRVWLTYSYIEYAPASIEKIRSLREQEALRLVGTGMPLTAPHGPAGAGYVLKTTTGSLTHDSMVIYPAYLDGSMSGLWAWQKRQQASTPSMLSRPNLTWNPGKQGYILAGDEGFTQAMMEG
ncbi:hypothetical protein Q3G72_021284 [Acer saccharum]|nr:hypothetical protein Q3G72_021284 [Acer saccharum]